MSPRTKRIFKKVKNTLIFWVVRIAMILLALFPLGVLRRVFGLLGRVVALIPMKLNRIAKGNLAFAFPEMDDAARRRMLLACYQSLGECGAEVLKMAVSGIKPSELCRFAPGTREVFASAAASGTGAVFITGHIGNWELMAAFTAEQGFPVYTIAKESYDLRFTALIREFRETRGVHCIWKGEPGIKEKILGVFLGGAFLGVLLDQDTKVPGVFADFFGKKAFTASLPAIIVHSAKIPAISAFIHRDGDGMNIITARPIDIVVPEGGDPIINITASFNKIIEDEIRSHPHEWVWMHERWKTRPKE